ncbi:MAG TPA: TetR/AcrR family transcriptional regulator [Trueperaceae bacterium]|nr:TetR/AcrR family transcriptional regulator [Trueperaceae bacterium]
MSDQPTPSAAERLLETASRLFYTRGVSNVGINEIIARAGVARMTLYHHFPSKDALIKAVLERRRAERNAWLERSQGNDTDPEGQILAVFDLFIEWAQSPDFRGDPLVTATFELGGQLNVARSYAQQHHEAFKKKVEALARQADLAEPRAVAVQLHLLVLGASVATLIDGNAEAATLAKSAAASLIVGAKLS